MRYQPSTPEDNNNITPTHPLKEFGTLLVGLLSFLFLVYLLLGFLVDHAVNHISPGLERALFSRTPLIWTTTAAPSPDPRQEKLQQLSDSLRQCAGISTPVSVHVQESDTVNALALPGGHIIVFSGLLDNLDSENGLSFVLAHELGHFQNRDHLRGLGRGLVLMTMAATITGPDSALTRLVTPTIQLTQAQYSQSRETQADQTGLDALHCYYGHVGGATDFFESMASKEDPATFSPYFGSHPEMQERVTALRRQAEEKNYPLKESRPLSFQNLSHGNQSTL